jgi:Holliday junction resolvase RusA-like endonuclease
MNQMMTPIAIPFILEGHVVPKPRMTRRDKWLDPPRPPVERYRGFAKDLLKMARSEGYNTQIDTITGIRWKAYLRIPKSWSKKKKSELRGKPHMQKPDTSNILKGIEDALTGRDETIYYIEGKKLWDDGRGERVEITLIINRLDI